MENVEDTRKKLVGKRVCVKNSFTTIFRKVTGILSAVEAIEIRVIRENASPNLLYVIEGDIESTSEKTVSDTLKSLSKVDSNKVRICIYPNTEVIPQDEKNLSEQIENTQDVFNLISSVDE